MRLMWDEDAWEEYLYWQTQDKKDLEEGEPSLEGYSAKRL